MRRIDPNPELLNMVGLLGLRSGDTMLDAQTGDDLLLRFAHDRSGDFGRAVGMCFGQETVAAVQEQLERWDLQGIEMMVAHPSQPIQLADNSCNGIILRHTSRLVNLENVFANLMLITKKNGRIVVRHTQWDIHLPHATEREQEMIDALASPGCRDGKEFFHRFSEVDRGRSWREVRFDVYTVASRDPRASTRHDYDWRTMLREQLGAARSFSPREMLDLIERLNDTRGAKVTVDRYLALGICR